MPALPMLSFLKHDNENNVYNKEKLLRCFCCRVNEHDNKHNLYNTGKVGIVALVVHVVFS